MKNTKAIINTVNTAKTNKAVKSMTPKASRSKAGQGRTYFCYGAVTKIEKGIPVPAPRTGGCDGSTTDLLLAMKVGDSALLPAGISQGSISGRAYSIKNGVGGEYSNYKVVTRVMPDGIRVWRLA